MSNPVTVSCTPVHLRRRQIMLSAGMLMATGSLPQAGWAQSKEYATMLLPFPAGGAGDFLARVLADKLPSALGRNVVVDNRPGGATRIAGEALKNGPNNGSMVLLTPVDPMFIVPAIYPSTRYDPMKDFKPISDVASLQFGIAVPASSPHKTLADYLKAARSQPSQADIGITLLGSLVHFLAMEFKTKSGTQGVLVPYKGAAPMITDLIGGQIPAGIDASTSFTEYHHNGKIRVLAVSGATRATSMPNVPTFAESGFPDLVASSTYALYGRADMPAAQVAEWNAAVRKALTSKDLQAKLLSTGYDLVPGSPPEVVDASVKKMAERWLPVIHQSGFKGD